MNAANLCPALVPVVETQERLTRDLDRQPSFPNRVKLGEGRESTRKLLAEFIEVTADEIVLRAIPARAITSCPAASS